MARTAGTSIAVARSTVETGKRLEALPTTASAVRTGALSLGQAAAVAEAAAADAKSEARLLAAAGNDDLKGLQQKARRVVLDSRGSVEERYERQRRLRSFSHWIDDEGMTAALMRGEVDRDADELCEVPGFGAVPVSVAREMLPDAFLKGVVVEGTRVTHVKHFGRRRSAEIDTALLVRTLLEQGDVCCDFEGCGRKDIEWDHTLDYAKIRETTEENLRPLCRFHHREKTAGRLIRRGRKWVRSTELAERGPP